MTFLEGQCITEEAVSLRNSEQHTQLLSTELEKIQASKDNLTPPENHVFADLELLKFTFVVVV